jgi:hypothetical protein
MCAAQNDVEDALCDLFDGCETTVRYFLLTDIHNSRVAVFEMERRWFDMKVGRGLFLNQVVV